MPVTSLLALSLSFTAIRSGNMHRSIMQLVIYRKLSVLLLLGFAVQAVVLSDSPMNCTAAAQPPGSVVQCTTWNEGCSPVDCPSQEWQIPTENDGCSDNNKCPDYSDSNVNGTLNITVQPTPNKRYYSVTASWRHLNLSATSEWRYELKVYENRDLITQGGVRCVCSSSQSSDWKTWDSVTYYYETSAATNQRYLLLLIYDSQGALHYAINGTFTAPSSCKDTQFLPLKNPRECTPPIYGEVRNLTYETSVVNVNQKQVSLSWRAPQENDQFQLPRLVYYINVTKLDEETAPSYHFKTNITNIVITPLDNNASYSIRIRTQVPCAKRCGRETTRIVNTSLSDSQFVSQAPLFPSPTPIPASSTLTPSSTPLPPSSTPLPASSTPTHFPPSSTPLPPSSTPTPLPPSSALTPSTIETVVPSIAIGVVILMLVAVIVVAIYLLRRRRPLRDNKMPPKLIVTSSITTSEDSKCTSNECFISYQTSPDNSTSSADSSDDRQNVVIIYSSRTNENDTHVILEHLVTMLGNGEYGSIYPTCYEHECTSVRKNAAAWLDSMLHSRNCTLLVVCNEQFLSDWKTVDDEEVRLDEISDGVSLIFTLKQIINGQFCYNRDLKNVGVILLKTMDHVYVPTYLQSAGGKFLVTDIEAIARFVNNETKYISRPRSS